MSASSEAWSNVMPFSPEMRRAQLPGGFGADVVIGAAGGTLRSPDGLVSVTAPPGGAGVLILDLDHFKAVNDTHGHAQGDLLLRAVAQRLRAVVREGDTVARLGGDEFVLVLPAVRRTSDALRVADKVLATLREDADVGDVDDWRWTGPTRAIIATAAPSPSSGAARPSASSTAPARSSSPSSSGGVTMLHSLKRERVPIRSWRKASATKARSGSSAARATSLTRPRPTPRSPPAPDASWPWLC